MPLPIAKVMRIVLGGNIGAENWSCGHWKADERDAVPTPAQINAYALSVANAFLADVWSVSGTPLSVENSADTTFNSCKVYYYQAGVLTHLGVGTITPSAGTSSANAHPAFVAWCVSLLSDSPGRSFRGRMYLPATALGLSGATSQVASSGAVDAVCNGVANYLHDAATNIPPWGSTGNAVNKIVSEKLGSMVDMTGIRLDSLPDTQHGRSRKLTAVHTATHVI